MEFVEAMVISGVLLAFVLFALLFIPQHTILFTQQPQLTNLAQQALDRVVLTEGDIAVRTQKAWIIRDLTLSAPRPLYQLQIDDGKILLLTNLPQADGCDIKQEDFVSETGINKAKIIGFGVLTPAESAVTVDYSAVLRNFFGDQWDLYDISIRIRPLVNLTICPNVKIGEITIRRSACGDVPPGVWVRSTAGGRVAVTVIYCEDECDSYSKVYNLKKHGSIYQVNILDDRLANLLKNSQVAIYTQRIDYPRAFDIYSFNLTARPLAYGMFPPFRDRQLWLLHYSLCQSDSTRQSIIVRRLQVYTGSGFIELGSDITLGDGNKANRCSDCSGSANCAACWVEVPADALFATAWVESSGQKLRSLIIIPLVPTPPIGYVKLDTWKRWTPLEPKLQTAVATRVVDSQSTTYLIELIVYKKP